LLRQEHENGRSILMITHDLTHGLNLCDRVAILNRGRIVQEVQSRDVTPAEFLQLYTQLTRNRKEAVRL
jgi:ABC-type dipeptide/oligopeptide/nickel transport system ATPase component